MHPILFEIGNWPVYSYGVLLALAYLAGLAAGRRARAARGPRRRAGHGPRHLPDHRGARRREADAGRRRLQLLPRSAARAAVARARGRRVLRRAARGVGVALWLVRRYKLPVWTTADMFAPGIALGHIIGRFGCLLAGCCYGRPTTVPWAITFTDPVAAANVGTPLGVPLHPTQLYDAGAELLILVVLLCDRAPRPAVSRPNVLAVHAALRDLALHHRDLPRRRTRHGLGLSTSQFVSLVLVPRQPGHDLRRTATTASRVAA